MATIGRRAYAEMYGPTTGDRVRLADTDLVFIDPVGTGYSRAAKPELAAKFFGLDGDIASVGDFIRRAMHGRANPADEGEMLE